MIAEDRQPETPTPVTRFLRLIRFSHTVFALPFALGALVVAANGVHSLRIFMLVLAVLSGGVVRMPQAAAQELIVNGGFEEPALSRSSQTPGQVMERSPMSHRVSRVLAGLVLGVSLALAALSSAGAQQARTFTVVNNTPFTFDCR